MWSQFVFHTFQTNSKNVVCRNKLEKMLNGTDCTKVSIKYTISTNNIMECISQIDAINKLSMRRHKMRDAHQSVVN